MKFLGVIILVAFLVSTFGLPLMQQQAEPTDVVSDVDGIIDLFLDAQIEGLEAEDNGIKDLWHRFKKAVKDYVGGRAAELKKLVIKYQPRIEEELAKIKKELIHEAKNIAVDLIKDIIKIIVQTDDGVEHVVYLPVKDLVVKPEESLMEVDSKIGDWFKMVWAKIVKFFNELGEKIKADWFKVKAWFDDLGRKIKEFFQKMFPRELGEKILAALKVAWKAIVAKFEATVEKYKDLIEKAITEDFKVFIAQAQKLLGTLVEGLTKIITDIIRKLIGDKSFNDQLMQAQFDFKEWWKMVVGIAKAYFKEKFDQFKAMGEKFKPIFEKFLKKLEDDFIHKGKGLVIDLLSDLIKIIIGWGDNAVFNDEELSTVDSKIGDWFKKVWLKIKAFFDDLGVKIKKFFDDLGIKIKVDWLKVKKWFDDLGAKIKAAFDKVFPPDFQKKVADAFKQLWEKIKTKAVEQFEKYKDAIISALEEDAKVIFKEGQKLLAAVVDGVAKFVMDIIRKIIGPPKPTAPPMFDDEQTEISVNGIKELWEKFKKMVTEYFEKKGHQFVDMWNTFEPKFVALVKKIGHAILDKLKWMSIDVLGDLIKIIIGWGDNSVMVLDDEALGNPIDDWFKKMWEKVKAIVIKFIDERNVEWVKFAHKYKPVFIAEWKALAKDLIHDGKQLLVDMLSDIIKIIVNPPKMVAA